jgi:hypothetical protein
MGREYIYYIVTQTYIEERRANVRRIAVTSTIQGTTIIEEPEDLLVGCMNSSSQQ